MREHLLALEPDARHMRFGHRVSDAWIETYVRGIDFARDSVDGWVGTPYHRFPLLEHNIRRFGLLDERTDERPGERTGEQTAA